MASSGNVQQLSRANVRMVDDDSDCPSRSDRQLKSCRFTTPTELSGSCRRLNFGSHIEDDLNSDNYLSAKDVVKYVHRIYEQQIDRWNFDFVTRTPLPGCWAWTAVATETTDHSASARASAARAVERVERRDLGGRMFLDSPVRLLISSERNNSTPAGDPV
jgi:hypothetical protein